MPAKRVRRSRLTIGHIREQAERGQPRIGIGLDRRGVLVKFHSQVGQDRFLLENFFRGKRGGVFVDIGAYDGETFSNSLFFERTMGWTGLCVEPLPSAFEKLQDEPQGDLRAGLRRRFRRRSRIHRSRRSRPQREDAERTDRAVRRPPSPLHAAPLGRAHDSQGPGDEIVEAAREARPVRHRLLLDRHRRCGNSDPVGARLRPVSHLRADCRRQFPGRAHCQADGGEGL